MPRTGHRHEHPRREHEDAHEGHGHEHPHREHEDAHEGHAHEHPSGPKGFLSSIFQPHSHDAADSVDDALAGSTEGIRAVKLSLLGLLLTAGLQVVIVVLSGSVALLADTIHNFGDAVTAIPLWIAFSLTSRPRTIATPMGTVARRILPLCSSS